MVYSVVGTTVLSAPDSELPRFSFPDESLLHLLNSIDFSTWWGMWKTHVFRKALGPRLQQIDPEYIIPEEEVLNLCTLFPPNSLFLSLG